VLGTADYLSPEQAKNPAAVDIRGDIYSLGCTLYFLLAGRPPFPGGTLMQKLLRHQQEEPMPIDALRPDMPAGLTAVVRRMMAKRTEDRYQTPAAVALALAPFCRLSMVAVPPVQSMPPLRLPVAHSRGQEDTPMPELAPERPDASTPLSTITGNGGRARAEADSTCQ
jgi:serine/threonine-protein kinase